MSIDNDDTGGAVAAFASGAIIGVVATLLLLRMQRNRAKDARGNEDEYCYDGGDLFV